MRKNGSELTPRETLFVAAYATTLNGAQALRELGSNPKNASNEARKILQRPVVRTAIAKAIEERIQKYRAVVDDVVEELRRIAFVDPTIAFQIHNGHVVVQDTSLLPDEVRRCISEIGETQWGIRVRFTDKVRALELLGRYLAMFHDNLNVDGRMARTPIEKMTDAELEAELARSSATKAPDAAGGEAAPGSP